MADAQPDLGEWRGEYARRRRQLVRYAVLYVYMYEFLSGAVCDSFALLECKGHGNQRRGDGIRARWTVCARDTCGRAIQQ
jgi:hypothetical protein